MERVGQQVEVAGDLVRMVGVGPGYKRDVQQERLVDYGVGGVG